MSRTTVTSKGQITVPKAIRERLAISKGDILEFKIGDRGDVQMCRVTERDLGVLRDFAPATAISVKQMKQAVRDRAKRQKS